MKKTRIAINGLGRIGRLVVRAIVEEKRRDIELVAVNGPADLATHRHLLQYDSVHGRFPAEVKTDGDALMIGEMRVPVFHERDVQKLDWGKLGADIVLECTGKFTSEADAGLHLGRGAKKVLISAPAKEKTVPTIVYGVNNEALKPEHKVLSVGSCTTNALAPVAKVIQDTVGIKHGFMTTIHAYTGDQNIHDGSHKDLRRARAAAMSMVPSSTGAAKAIGLVLPELAGKLAGTAIRVPTPNVSLVDLVVETESDACVDAIHAAMKAAASGAMKGVLEYCEEPLVSIDFVHNPHSSIFDATQTVVTGKTSLRIASWYDNEWGFSIRMLDVARLADIS